MDDLALVNAQRDVKRVLGQRHELPPRAGFLTESVLLYELDDRQNVVLQEVSEARVALVQTHR